MQMHDVNGILCFLEHREGPISLIKSFVKISIIEQHYQIQLAHFLQYGVHRGCHTQNDDLLFLPLETSIFLGEPIALHESIFPRGDQDSPTTTDKLRISRIIQLNRTFLQPRCTPRFRGIISPKLRSHSMRRIRGEIVEISKFYGNTDFHGKKPPIEFRFDNPNDSRKFFFSFRSLMPDS